MKRVLPFLWLPLLLACSLGSELGSRDWTPCLPPEGFTEADLIGTWEAAADEDFVTDTLVIREDGLYKQTIHMRLPDFHYESDWLPWQVEYLNKGTVYVHLTGMLLYAYNPAFLEEGIEGGGEHSFIDYCRWGPSVMPGGKEVYVGVRMPPGEVVLRVMADRPVPFPFHDLDPSPRGFTLSLLPQTDVSSWYYEVQEP